MFTMPCLMDDDAIFNGEWPIHAHTRTKQANHWVSSGVPSCERPLLQLAGGAPSWWAIPLSPWRACLACTAYTPPHNRKSHEEVQHES
jgi:hypothetical protein